LSQASDGRADVPGEDGALTGTQRIAKMKNSGNEAKKCLKTNDITFLNGANFAHFARKLTAI
jgi:hypothetical protein